jgi:hypothetical protein
MERATSFNSTFLEGISPNRFTFGVFFFRGAEICRGVKMGFFSDTFTGEGGLVGRSGGVGTLSLLIPGSFSEIEEPKGVFRRGMLNSLTISMVSPVALVWLLFTLVGASNAGRWVELSMEGSFGREDRGGGSGTLGFGGEGLTGFSSMEDCFGGDGLGAGVG